MTAWLRDRWVPLTVLVVATAALVASVVWVAGGLPGAARVRSMDDAGRAATRFGDRWGLHAGEVMQFDNGFYVELLDRAGNRATEVLVDPPTGAVQIEWGPAMMWNTVHGMHPPSGGQTATVTPDHARRIADQWLRDNRPGEHADEAESFPGYYTLHTLRGNDAVSMLSVHATSGAVWYHTWHGRFIRMQEQSD